MGGQATGYRTERLPADAAGVDAAAALLRAGEPVAVPTETVYGLAADATDARAVARVYEAKGRPSFNPLIVHVDSVESAGQLVHLNDAARELAARWWPGPLTLVLPLRNDAGLAGIVTAGLRTLAVRVPAHPVMRAVLSAAGRPLAAPSANASGRISATTAGHVLTSLDGRVPLVLDDGPCPTGIESTIVDLGGEPAILRAGAIPAEALGLPVCEGAPVTAPGMMASHYAPAQPVALNVVTAPAGAFHIGFGVVAGDANLSTSGDLVEAAARLFDLLHAAEASGREIIAVAPIPDTGLGRAINDRLRRAAAPRG